jgi:hypothetical protein
VGLCQIKYTSYIAKYSNEDNRIFFPIYMLAMQI